MSNPYPRLAQIVKNLAQGRQLGREFVITRQPASQTIDPVTGATQCFNELDEPIACVPTTFNVWGIAPPMPEDLIDGTRVLRSDVFIVLDAQEYTPSMTDKIDGMNIVERIIVEPGDGVVAHKLVTRK